MMKKTIIRVSIGLASVVVLLFVMLCIHIALAIKNKPSVVLNQRQMARIDFKEPVDSLEALKIKNYVAGLKGIDGVHFNLESNMLAYSFYIEKQNGQAVYDSVMTIQSHPAERYIPDAATIAKGCPAFTNDNSFSAHLTKYISKLFN